MFWLGVWIKLFGYLLYLLVVCWSFLLSIVKGEKSFSLFNQLFIYGLSSIAFIEVLKFRFDGSEPKEREHWLNNCVGGLKLYE